MRHACVRRSVVQHKRVARDVAPDGSPISVYNALPLRPEFTPVLEFLTPPASMLDLGCGVGRLANELARRGFDVTGVDESPEMLAHVDRAIDAVRSDINGLALRRPFDVVVLASHLVNVGDANLRRAFLKAAADHVEPGGVVLIQHWEFPPAAPQDADVEVGDVRVQFSVLSLQGKRLDGRVIYTGRTILDAAVHQPFTRRGRPCCRTAFRRTPARFGVVRQVVRRSSSRSLAAVAMGYRLVSNYLHLRAITCSHRRCPAS